MNARPKTVDRILERIEAAQTFCVVGHVRPDGDCVGSQLSMTLALRGLGKQAVCWNEDPMPDKLAFLDPDKLFERPRPGQEFDCVIALDSANYERLGKVGSAIARRQCLINIDHHQSNTRFGNLNWVSWRESSTGELVFRLLKMARWPITPQIAGNLFAAVSTDTGSFQYATTKPVTFHTAGELVRRGADLAEISHEVYHSYPLCRIRLLKHLYNQFRLTHDDRIAYLWVRQRDFARTGADPSDVEGLIDHIRAMEPVVVACLFEEIEPGLTRVSWRSKSEKVNVGAVAAQFGGGGHPAAAGARIQGPPLAVQRRVIAAVRKALNGTR